MTGASAARTRMRGKISTKEKAARRRPSVTGHWSRSQLFQLLEQLLALRDGPRLVDLHVPDVPLAIEHVGRALVHAALLVEDAVGLAHRAVRPVVGEQGKGHAAELLGPALQARRGVGADLQDLAVELLEVLVVRTEPVDLVRSPAGEGEWHERHHHRAPAEAREGNLLVRVMRGEGKIRRRAAYF